MAFRPTAARSCAIIALATVLSLSCDDSTGPAGGVEVSNETDRFTFRIANVADFSGTYRYNWTNTGTTATVDVTAAPTGIGTITINDADGKEVFTTTQLSAGTFTTDAGRAGTWVVNVLLVRIAGTLALRVEKP